MHSIFIEGRDGCFKSTLAKELLTYFPYGIYSVGGPPADDETAITYCSKQRAISRTESVIFDRLTAFSRLCYEPNLSEEHKDNLVGWLDTTLPNGILIWCDTDKPKHEIETYDDTAHLHDIAHRAVSIHNKYVELMSFYDHIKYNGYNMSVEDLVEKIYEL